MSTKKSRQPLNDALASEFVYGLGKSSEVSQEEATLAEESSPASASTTKRKEPNLMSKLQSPAKEPIVRFTVDMPESMHRKLSILAAKTGRKKADIVRMLLDEALSEAEE